MIILSEIGYILAQRALDDPREVEYLVYPIVFLYRHYLELEIKTMIHIFGPLVGVKLEKQNHDLMKIWDLFKKMLGRFGQCEADRKDTANAGRLIKEFHDLDKSSTNFRYPYNKSGAVTNLGRASLDISNLKQRMQGLENYFTACDGYLSEEKFI